MRTTYLTPNESGQFVKKTETAGDTERTVTYKGVPMLDPATAVSYLKSSDGGAGVYNAMATLLFPHMGAFYTYAITSGIDDDTERKRSLSKMIRNHIIRAGVDYDDKSKAGRTINQYASRFASFINASRFHKDKDGRPSPAYVKDSKGNLPPVQVIQSVRNIADTDDVNNKRGKMVVDSIVVLADNGNSPEEAADLVNLAWLDPERKGDKTVSPDWLLDFATQLVDVAQAAKTRAANVSGNREPALA